MPTSMTTAPSLHHVRGDELRPADGRDQDVRLPGDGGQVPGAGVADRSPWRPRPSPSAPACWRWACPRCCCGRPPRRGCPATFDARVREQLLDAERRARAEARLARHDPAQAHGVEAVHVLLGRDGVDHLAARRCASGSGSCTRMPWIFGSLFSLSTRASSSASGVVAGQVVLLGVDADLVRGLVLALHVADCEAGFSPTRTTARPGVTPRLLLQGLDVRRDLLPDLRRRSRSRR